MTKFDVSDYNKMTVGDLKITAEEIKEVEKMSKIKWEKANLCGTEPGIAKDDSVFEYWHTEYGGIFCEILPTNIIHGNKDFGKEECSWTVNIMNLRVVTAKHNNVYFREGASFGTYKSVLAAKRDANKCILALVEKGR